MDKKSKVIIVALIGLGVAFALGLGTNLLRDEGTNEEKEKEKYRKGLVRSMDDLLGRFSPRLDASRLLPLPDCEIVPKLQPPDCLNVPSDVIECGRNDNVLTLTSNVKCAINIRPRLPDCDDDYESTTLKLAEGAATTRAAAARIKMNPALIQAQPFSRLKMKQPAISLPKLVVWYKPEGKPDKRRIDEEEKGDEFRLVVLKQGGTLTLECKSCSKTQPVNVILATRESCDD